MRSLNRFARCLGVGLALACSLSSIANEYPARPISIIVPFAAGGPTDTLARHLARIMTSSLKQRVIVENFTGAGGIIGSARVARSKPDGYALLLTHTGHATSIWLYRKLEFHPVNDFEPIGLVADVPMTLVAKQALPPANLKEFVSYIKANKDTMTYGNAGLGSVSHLCGLLFMSAIEADVQTVPYRGTAPALADLLSGQIDFLCDQTTNTASHIKAGKVKAYGVTTGERVASMPSVPTLNEQGLTGFNMAVWHGLYAPRGTPKTVIDKLSQALQTALKDAMLKARLADFGAHPVSQDKAQPQALRAHLKAEIDRWGPVIKKAGIYAD